MLAKDKKIALEKNTNDQNPPSQAHNHQLQSWMLHPLHHSVLGCKKYTFTYLILVSLAT